MALVLTEVGESAKCKEFGAPPGTSASAGAIGVDIRVASLGVLDAEVARGAWSAEASAQPAEGTAIASASAAPICSSPPRGIGFVAAGRIISAPTEARAGLEKGNRALVALPLDAEQGTVADTVFCHQRCAFPIPDGVNDDDAAALFAPGLFAYTVLHYKLKASPGETLLLFGAASPEGRVLAQLAAVHQLRVFAVARDEDEAMMLRGERSGAVDVVFEAAGSAPRAWESSLMEETGGLGADFVVECDQPAPGNEGEALRSLDAMLRCVSAHGHLVLQRRSSELPPPSVAQLLLKNASVSLVLPQVWLMCPLQQGRLLHIVHDLFARAAAGQLRPPECSVLSREEAVRKLLPALRSAVATKCVLVRNG